MSDLFLVEQIRRRTYFSYTMRLTIWSQLLAIIFKI